MVQTWSREDCQSVFAAKRQAEERELERLEKRLFWLRLVAIGLAALYIIGRLS